MLMISKVSFVFLVCELWCTAARFHESVDGDACRWLNATGTCTDARSCASFTFDIEQGRNPSVCSFKGKETAICCVDCYILKPNESITDMLDRDYFKTGRRYEEACMTYQYLLPYECKTHVTNDNKRVWNEGKQCYDYVQSAAAPVGGEDTLRGDFPHMALLGYGEDLETAQWLCGGSLISEKHILTAAHCAADVRLGPVRFVALGMLKRSDPPHYWKRYRVKLFYPHPGYKPPSKYHDIAIIETEPSVNLTEGVRPACLTHKMEFREDDVAFATGWGSLGHRKENADVMQKVVLKKFTTEECASQYPAHRHLLQGYNHTTQVCYGDRTLVRDTCQGDSGGPLQKRDPTARYCPYAIIGVTSSGHACGTPGQAGLYTRVAHYLPWIESVIWP